MTLGATGQRGAVAGLDALLFGTLILLAGTMLVVNLWANIETRTALDAATREYLRSYTVAPDGPTAAQQGELAARAVLAHRGTPLRDLRIDGPDPSRFGPCQPSTVRLGATVSAIRLPFVGELSAVAVEVSATELVPPHREVSTGPTHDRSATPCAP